jgi:excisionase family DNA binding protein
MTDTTTQPHIRPRMLRLDQAATYCSLSKPSLYALAAQGLIRIQKFGSLSLVPTASLDAYLDSLPDAEITRKLRPADIKPGGGAAKSKRGISRGTDRHD